MSATTDPLRPEDLDAFAQTYDIPGATRQLPPKPSKGNSFDFSSIRVQSAEDFAALPESQKQLLRNIKQGIQYTPEAAASFVEEFNNRLIEQSSPQAQAQAQAAQLSAEKTQLEKRKLEQEQITKAKEQAELAARKSIVLSKIEKYTNPEAQGYVDIEPLVGKFDGTAGAMLDAGGANDQRAAQRAELERLVNTDVLELTKFLKPVSQDELKFLKSMTPRLHQNDTIWREYLLDAKSRLEALPTGETQPATQAAPQATPMPQAPAAPATRVIGGRTFVLQPNGKYLPR
jgi:hypothetical protein